MAAFASGNTDVITYCLPAHTSCTTQPLDLTLFGSYKHYLGDAVRRMGSIAQDTSYDVFDFGRILGYAYQ